MHNMSGYDKHAWTFETHCYASFLSYPKMLGWASVNVLCNKYFIKIHFRFSIGDVSIFNTFCVIDLKSRQDCDIVSKVTRKWFCEIIKA